MMSERYMSAYYHTFEPTGVAAVDATLEAVALAGKGYHHTGSWADAEQYGPNGYWDLIQTKAEDSAKEITRLREQVTDLQNKLAAAYCAHKIRCGDAVLHRPTGETWLVAYADYEQNVLSWSGFPEGSAKLSDCEVTRVATDDQHRKHVEEWLAKPSGGDHRRYAIERLYGPPAPPKETK